MKYFFRRAIPSADDILLIESGSPNVARRALERIRAIFPGARFHLLTCQPETSGQEVSTVYRIADYPGAREKIRLLRSFRAQGWRVLAILCTGESILWRAKMLALLLMPAKVLIVNENADFFWLDWGNRRTLRIFLGIRWGVHLGDLLSTFFRALLSPLTFLFLLLNAAILYLRRGWRLLAWKLGAPPPQRFAYQTAPTASPENPREADRRVVDGRMSEQMPAAVNDETGASPAYQEAPEGRNR